jgi:hypothetical protein
MKKILGSLRVVSCIALLIFSWEVSASFPNNEEESHDNEFCQYDKYKGRDPKYCPHIEVINYGVTVYFHDELQSKLRVFLDETIESKKINQNITL